jgi:hypothetical protein
VGEAEAGIGADDGVGEGVQPAAHGGDLAAGPQDRRGDAGDQVGGGGIVGRGHVQVDRLDQHRLLLVPGGGAPVELRHELAVLPAQALAQVVGKQPVIAVPAPVRVERHQEEAGPL